MARLRTVATSALAALAAAALASACATVPTAGRPTQVTGVNGQGQPYVRPVPPRPAPSWSEEEIVQGFMAASASFADHHAAARAFLSPQLRKTWRPGWAAAVVGGQPHLTLKGVGPRNILGESTPIATVSMTGHQLATISNIGQYLVSPASQDYKFKLARFNKQWLITQLPQPSSVLLLTQTDFEQVYQPRNLYVWSRNGQSLVPEPAFAPLEGGDANRTVATNLVTALLTSQPQSSWLGSDTTTAFPRGTRLLGRANAQVAINGSTAVVNLSGAAARAGPDQLTHMAAQLVMTLTSTSYAQTAISRSVVLEINGRPRTIMGRQVLQPDLFQPLIPGYRQPRSPLYYLESSGAISELDPGADAPRVVQRPRDKEQSRFSLIAVSPSGDSQFAGAVKVSNGCVIYYGALGTTATLRHAMISGPGPCTSLSWDSQGNIWAVADQTVWVLPAGTRQPMNVAVPPLRGIRPDRVLALRVAPDGVRAAMLLQRPGGPRQIVLTAISGTGASIVFDAAVTVGAGVTNPLALSWYDSDHLIVLSRSQLYQVPANGGPALSVAGVSLGTRSVTALGPGQIATEANGEVLTSTGPDENQERVAKGTSPAYPG
jgi:hypothetical protein